MNEKPVILPVNYKPTLEEFLDVLGVKSTRLGAKLFTGVYEQFFVSSVDLKAAYESYYCVEYSTFRDYLELAHEIYLSSEDLEKNYIFEINRLLMIVDQGYEDSTLDIVLDCIEKLEAEHENQNGLRVQ